MSFLFLATISKNVIGFVHLLSLTPTPRLSHLHFSSLNIQLEMKKADSVSYIDFITLRQVIICILHMPDYVFCAFLKLLVFCLFLIYLQELVVMYTVACIFSVLKVFPDKQNLNFNIVQFVLLLYGWCFLCPI